jgi:hypothetical protein
MCPLQLQLTLSYEPSFLGETPRPPGLASLGPLYQFSFLREKNSRVPPHLSQTAERRDTGQDARFTACIARSAGCGFGDIRRPERSETRGVWGVTPQERLIFLLLPILLFAGSWMSRQTKARAKRDQVGPQERSIYCLYCSLRELYGIVTYLEASRISPFEGPLWFGHLDSVNSEIRNRTTNYEPPKRLG